MGIGFKPNRRKLANFMLQPFLQLRLAMVSVVLTFVFMVGAGSFLTFKLYQFADVVVTATEANSVVHGLIQDYLTNLFGMAVVFGLVLLVAVLLSTIYLTHKMVGPTVAFRRHLGQLERGEYGRLINLRPGDAFVEVADALNNLSRALAKKHGAWQPDRTGSQQRREGHESAA